MNLDLLEIGSAKGNANAESSYVHCDTDIRFRRCRRLRVSTATTDGSDHRVEITISNRGEIRWRSRASDVHRLRSGGADEMHRAVVLRAIPVAVLQAVSIAPLWRNRAQEIILVPQPQLWDREVGHRSHSEPNRVLQAGMPDCQNPVLGGFRTARLSQASLPQAEAMSTDYRDCVRERLQPSGLHTGFQEPQPGL